MDEDGSLTSAASPQMRDAGHEVYRKSCQGCHGETLQGGVGPSLRTITNRLDDTTIRLILKRGQGQMPALPNLEEDAVTNLLAFLHESGVKKDVNYNSSEDKPYPADAYIPGGRKRYFSGWGFAPALIGPPWSTLTAYDLNLGKIKWQIPYGEAMGVAPKGNNYGILQFHGPKASVAVTASGLLFAATPDSKFRAWDKETGRVLWSDDLPDPAGGIPAIYEIDGKEYMTISVRGRYITYALSDGKFGPSTIRH